jgi:enoyl-CoA hydratase/carnithine racemase
MLKVDITERIATLTISRPERRNAMTSELALNLSRYLEEFSHMGDICAVILTGEQPGFCAGSDLKELAGKSVEEMKNIELAKGELIGKMVASAPPLIAAVEGFALGGGFVLAAACDYVVSAANTRWHMPEAQNGWIPPWGIDVLTLRAGTYRARQLVCGLPLTGMAAGQFGIVDHVCESGAALTEARKHAETLAALAPHVLATIKTQFGKSIETRFRTNDIRTADLFKENCRHEPAISTLSRYGVRNV